MLDFKVIGLEQALKGIADIPKQVRFATIVALTRTAKIVHAGLTAEMGKVFDRPVPYTMRGLAWLSASKDRPESKVFARYFSGKGTPAEYYLNPQVYGGQRRIKRFERALQYKGLMPAGMMAVPGPGARLDSYGNMSRGQIVQILGALKAFGEVGYMANRTQSARSKRNQRNSQYFVAIPGRTKLAPGVWQRKGKAIMPVLLYVNSAHYSVRLRFNEVGERIVSQNYEREFETAIAQAIATAR